MTTPTPEPPQADADSAAFWTGLRAERIVLQRCSGCERLRFPPLGRCPYCRGTDAVHETVAGTGSVYSWTVVHRAFDPAFVADLPYVVATVDLDVGPRLALRLEGRAPAFGAAVTPRFVHHAEWTELRMVTDA
jgi:uncharacterized protein